MRFLILQEVLNHSDTTAVLQLINVVAGRYVFSLEVADAEGVSATDTASIIIREGESSFSTTSPFNMSFTMYNV